MVTHFIYYIFFITLITNELQLQQNSTCSKCIILISGVGKNLRFSFFFLLYLALPRWSGAVLNKKWQMIPNLTEHRSSS